MCVQGPSLLGVSRGRDGGLADLCLVPASGVHRLPDGVTALQAAAAEPACCATRAIRRGGVRIGDNVVIFGAEDYGLYATSWLASAGVNATVVIDPNENRRRAAKAMGATAVLDPREDVATSVAELLPFGADVAIVNFEDYVPESDRYLAQAIEVCRPQGTVITLRAYGNGPYQQLRPHPPWLKEITLKHFGNFFGEEPVQGGRARGDWAVTLQAMADGRLTTPPEGALTVSFDELRGDSDVARMMAALPATATKALVVME
jgi:threonine dehydrogenase-like Zn-dependent dehydrogenase